MRRLRQPRRAPRVVERIRACEEEGAHDEGVARAQSVRDRNAAWERARATRNGIDAVTLAYLQR